MIMSKQHREYKIVDHLATKVEIKSLLISLGSNLKSTLLPLLHSVLKATPGLTIIAVAFVNIYALLALMHYCVGNSQKNYQ